MAHLIDKDALVAEIEKRLWLLEPKMTFHQQRVELEKLLSFLDTIEVKDVDLEEGKKEELAQKYIDYTFKRHNIDPESKEGQLIYYAYMHGMNQCLEKLKAQKGE